MARQIEVRVRPFIRRIVCDRTRYKKGLLRIRETALRRRLWHPKCRGRHWPGTLSYSMYLFHFAIIDLCHVAPLEWRVGTVTCIISFTFVLVVMMGAAKMSGARLDCNDRAPF